MDTADKSGDGAPSSTVQVKQEPKILDNKEMELEETGASKSEPVTVKTEQVTPVKVKTEPATPHKPDSVKQGITETAGDGETLPKTEKKGESSGAKTEGDGLDVLSLVDDTTMINDLDADLINSQGKTSAGTTDVTPKGKGQTDSKVADTKMPSTEDGVAKDKKEAEGDEKKAEDDTDEKKADGDDKTKRLVGFVCSLSLASSFDFHIGKGMLTQDLISYSRVKVFFFTGTKFPNASL